MIRWWPSIGLAGVLLLGWAVGRSSTPIDEWFQQHNRSPLRWLTVFADPRLLIPLLVVVVGVAVRQRRWRLAAVAVLAPPVGLAFVRVLKAIFDRQKEGGLAYPSGHITTTTIVMGLVILVAGAASWAVVAAVCAVALAMLGVGSTFHYFTDVIGGLLLGSSIVCAAAVIARRDLTCVNPRAIWVTRGS